MNKIKQKHENRNNARVVTQKLLGHSIRLNSKSLALLLKQAATTPATLIILMSFDFKQTFILAYIIPATLCLIGLHLFNKKTIKPKIVVENFDEISDRIETVFNTLDDDFDFSSSNSTYEEVKQLQEISNTIKNSESNKPLKKIEARKFNLTALVFSVTFCWATLIELTTLVLFTF